MAVTHATPNTPTTIITELLAEIAGHVPGIRDGAVESVHQARVATRRLREVLPLVAFANEEEFARAMKMVRNLGRSLGRVRELDVMREHLDRIAADYPDAATATAVACRSIGKQQQKARRRLIKGMEHLRADRIAVNARPSTHWRATLRERIGDEAQNVSEAVAHASGVYFPKRAHSARIEVKKLRYSAELAEQTALWQPPRLVRDLKRIQASLGDLHDAQVLLDHVRDVILPDDVSAEERTVLVSALNAEIARHHQAYLAKRYRLQAITDACGRFAAKGESRIRTWRRPLLAASAVVVPAGLLLVAGKRSAS